jgi:hypothetical protein
MKEKLYLSTRKRVECIVIIIYVLKMWSSFSIKHGDVLKAKRKATPLAFFLKLAHFECLYITRPIPI